jgi:uncharacterized protein YfaQ (DUF2300 family)
VVHTARTPVARIWKLMISRFLLGSARPGSARPGSASEADPEKNYCAPQVSTKLWTWAHHPVVTIASSS